MAQDYYETLGVNRKASDEDIRKAFHRMAKKYHPDANPDNPAAEANFKNINEAYDTLKDSEKRAQYDRFGADYERFQGFQQPGRGGFRTNVDMDGSAFSDIFETLFSGAGGRTRSRGPARGQDIDHRVTISLREAHEGTTRYVTKGERRIKVNIPAGAATGTKVRLVGEGEAGMLGGAAGDLYLVVEVTPDKQFDRDGDDLYVDVDVDMFTALLGGDVLVPTLNRPVKMKIPAGTQSGQRLRVAGKGMPRLRKKKASGNLYARVRISVPKKLTPEQEDLVRQLRETFE